MINFSFQIHLILLCTQLQVTRFVEVIWVRALSAICRHISEPSSPRPSWRWFTRCRVEGKDCESQPRLVPKEQWMAAKPGAECGSPTLTLQPRAHLWAVSPPSSWPYSPFIFQPATKLCPGLRGDSVMRSADSEAPCSPVNTLMPAASE